MPTVAQNEALWSEDYDWSHAGDRWSAKWGGVDMQWFGTLLPRVHAFLPAGTILEIACGYGRWAQYLKDECQQLILVDLEEHCVEACQQRFADETHIAYHVTDGKSLDMIADHSVDFAFSFDSLVHAESDVIEAYLRGLAQKLTVDGVGFIHHSNLGEFSTYFGAVGKAPAAVRDRLYRWKLAEKDHWRG
ncbi:MAG: class I SAM-dependent methyltransferase, partial [Caldilineales bacterium]|nr:class I SAM-dependent methyltransferase [Caldilineales bacterium]